MLADEICTEGYFCASPNELLTRASEAIARAGRFVVAREILVAANFISEAMPSSLLRGLPLCRLPYPATWFEYAGHDRPGITDPEITLPQRIGMLCESDPAAPHQVNVNLFWRHKRLGGKPQMSPVSMTLDFSPDGDRGRDMDCEPRNKEESLSDLKEWFLRSELPRNQAIAANATELEAALALSSRCNLDKSAYFEGEAEGIIGRVSRAAETLPNVPRGGTSSDAGMLLGIIMLLNTHNGTRQQTADLGKLNVARAKRRLPALLGYSTVTLHLAGRRAENQQWGHSGQAVREHLGPVDIHRSQINAPTRNNIAAKDTAVFS
jgi:hypothetical protein